MKLLKLNFLLLILLALFACSINEANSTSTNPSTTSLFIDYDIAEDFYIALTNTNVLLEQKTDFGSQAKFFINPSLPSGLSLDSTNGNISGIPTTSSLPILYLITVTVDGKSYTKVIFLGVAPSVVWVTNINTLKRYELIAYVVGDGSKQINDWTWVSSDELLATVNGGVVNIKVSLTGGTVVISATKNSYSNGVVFTIPRASIDYDIAEDFYIALTNTNILLEQKTDFGSQANFYVSPSLPNGLSLDVTNGNISGTPTTSSVPTRYIVKARIGSETYTKAISLGVVPSVVWVTPISSNFLKAYVVGDGVRQTGISWGSSDENLLTVVNGLVNLTDTAMGGSSAIIYATKNISAGLAQGSYSNGISIGVEEINGSKAITMGTSTHLIIDNGTIILINSRFLNKSLTSVIIPNSVRYIDKQVFDNNQLTSVVIPDSVTNIGNFAFALNPNLVEVSLKQSLYTKITNTSSTNAVFGTQVTNYIKRP